MNCSRLTGLCAAVLKSTRAEIERRIDRWLGKYPAAAKWLEAELIRNGENRAYGLRLRNSG